MKKLMMMEVSIQDGNLEEARELTMLILKRLKISMKWPNLVHKKVLDLKD
jgi:hypothetical protein